MRISILSTESQSVCLFFVTACLLPSSVLGCPGKAFAAEFAVMDGEALALPLSSNQTTNSSNLTCRVPAALILLVLAITSNSVRQSMDN